MLAVEFLADDVGELNVLLTADERADLIALEEHYGSDRAVCAIEKCRS
jgi:hypothetical protein